MSHTSAGASKRVAKKPKDHKAPSKPPPEPPPSPDTAPVIIIAPSSRLAEAKGHSTPSSSDSSSSPLPSFAQSQPLLTVSALSASSSFTTVRRQRPDRRVFDPNKVTMQVIASNPSSSVDSSHHASGRPPFSGLIDALCAIKIANQGLFFLERQRSFADYPHPTVDQQGRFYYDPTEPMVLTDLNPDLTAADEEESARVPAVTTKQANEDLEDLDWQDDDDRETAPATLSVEADRPAAAVKSELEEERSSLQKQLHKRADVRSFVSARNPIQTRTSSATPAPAPAMSLFSAPEPPPKPVVLRPLEEVLKLKRMKLEPVESSSAASAASSAAPILCSECRFFGELTCSHAKTVAPQS